MKSRIEKTLVIALLALLLGLALMAQLLKPEADSDGGSVASTEPRGRRALFLLLRELGFQAEAWIDAPGELPRNGELLWLAEAPGEGSRIQSEGEEGSEDEGESEDEGQTEDEGEGVTTPVPDSQIPTPVSPARLGLRASSHYRRFVEEGGTLVLPHDDDAREFLVDTLGIEAAADVEARSADAGPRRFRDLRGEELEVDVDDGGVLIPPQAGSAASALWWKDGSDGDIQEALAISIPVGSGQVVLLGDDDFLANDRIGEHDHALFAVRLAEELARGRRVLFDQYALGLWRPRTAVALLASPSLFLVSLHLVLLLSLLVARSAWVREFPRDPPAHEALSPLVRARVLAALLSRAGRTAVLRRASETVKTRRPANLV